MGRCNVFAQTNQFGAITLGELFLGRAFNPRVVLRPCGVAERHLAGAAGTHGLKPAPRVLLESSWRSPFHPRTPAADPAASVPR